MRVRWLKRKIRSVHLRTAGLALSIFGMGVIPPSSTLLHTSPVILPSDNKTKDLLLMITVASYIYGLYYIHSKRKCMGVTNRSPMIILFGGVCKILSHSSLWLALLLDAIINYAINFSCNVTVECLLGIYTTCSHFFVAWACIALR